MRVKRCVFIVLSIVAVVAVTVTSLNMLDVRAKVYYEDIENFPESYRAALYTLKEKHPNWTFEVMNTGLDWSTVLYNEMNPAERSLVPSYFQSDFVGAYYGDGWSCATQAAVEYYMDPRNWLTEDYIFQFEKLTYNGSTQGIATIQKALQNTFMSGFIQSDAKNDYASMGLTYAKAFYDIGNSIGVSPVHLATRVKQEQGTQGTSDLISGTYPGYEGYYNYYNIQASGSNHEQIVANGLNEAKAEGWDTRYGALLGGSQKVANRYILRGQDTLYLQKFDVDGTYDGRYWHQYMQNLAAPSNEGRNTKKAYESAGMLDEAFVFKIPVYNNMPYTQNESAWIFVKNMYLKILGREGSTQEIQSWANGMLQNGVSCAEVADQFISSEEYRTKRTSNSDYVRMLYVALLNRTPDSSEVSAWTSALDSEYSRRYVLQQFLSSEEFIRICDENDLKAGSISVSEDEKYNTEENMEKFVRLLYNNVLGRECSDDECQSWVSGMKYNNLTCSDLAYRFMFSDEYTNKNTSNEEYISMLYRTLLDRVPDSSEVTSWTRALDRAYSRKYVLQQFLSSEEFIRICTELRLKAGNLDVSDDEVYDATQNMSLYVNLLYNNVLGRACSTEENQSWVKGMKYDNLSCADLANSFIFSDEYKNMQTSNASYVAMLYRTLLRREPDSSEVNAWVTVLNDCYSRKYVLQRFVTSEEFIRISNELRLTPGNINVSDDEIFDTTQSIQMFVKNVYQNVLGRQADDEEIQSWTKGMKTDGLTCADVIYSFVFSDEYTRQNTSNAEYARMLYVALLEREPDTSEVMAWSAGLDNGDSRKYVLSCFISSEEFNRLCSQRRLNAGSISVENE